MGIVKTKERASTCMFCPKMYNDIERYLATCRACMAHKIKQGAEPLECDIPSSPWSSLTLYKGLIICDRFSRFIIVKMPKDLSARSTIMCLLEVFCEHGVPSFIHSDRGRNFKGLQPILSRLGHLSQWYHTVIIKLRGLYIQ